jgi:hypothetical protein
MADERLVFARPPRQEIESWRRARWRQIPAPAKYGQATMEPAMQSYDPTALDLTPEYRAKMTRRAIAQEEAALAKQEREKDGMEWAEPFLAYIEEREERLRGMRTAVEGYEKEAEFLSWARANFYANTKGVSRFSTPAWAFLLVAVPVCIFLMVLPFLQFPFPDFVPDFVNTFIGREVSAIGLALAVVALAWPWRRP